MTCGCPAWKKYVNTEEVCGLPISDGSIFFLVGESEAVSVVTYGDYLTYQEGVDPTIENGAVDFEGLIYFNTSLPNPELGEWRYELDGTFTPGVDYGTLADCVGVVLSGAGTPEDEFSWECSVTFPIGDSLVSYTLLCGDPPWPAGYTNWLPFYQINGTLRIYYDWNGTEYGPITIYTTAGKGLALTCY